MLAAISGTKEINLKYKIDKLEINSKINSYKGISDFKNGYQLRTNRVNDDEGDLFVDCNKSWARWRNYLSHPFNLQGFSDVRQAEIHTSGPQVREPTASDFVLAIEKLKGHKLQDID